MDGENFQKPANAQTAPKPNGSGSVIHAMAKEYRGGVASIVRKSAPAPVQSIPVPQPVQQPKPAPVPVVAKPPVPVKKSIVPVVVLTLGIILMLAAGVIVYFAYTQTKTPPQTQVVVPPTTTPTPIPTPVPVPEPPKVPEGGVDSDSDGLSDVEELRLYTTLVFNPDTDNDTFLDGNEVFHLYDPTKPNFTRLADSGIVKLYSQPLTKFSLFLPVSFIASESVDGMEVTWSIPSGENMKITAYPNPEQSGLQTWFAAKFPERSGDVMLPFTTKSGVNGLQSSTRLETFLEGNGMVYGVQYLLGVAKAIEYRQTYAMMLNSFLAQ